MTPAAALRKKKKITLHCPKYPALLKRKQNKSNVHAFCSCESNGLNFEQTAPLRNIHRKSKIKKKKACLFNYNVYSNTANSHFILKYTGVDFMQQQQVRYKSYKK